jgi:hypothetical protein
MDDRCNKRVVVDLELDARVGSQVTRVLVYDLSVDGCMIEAKAGPLPGKGGAIELPLPHAGVTEGTLAWAQGRYGGVLFADRLHAAVVDYLGFRPTPDRAHVLRDRFGRPVLGRRRHPR